MDNIQKLSETVIKLQKKLQDTNTKLAESRRQNDELATAKAQLVQEKGDLAKQKDEEIRNLHNDYKKQLEAKEDQHNRAIDELKASHRARLNEEAEEQKKNLVSERQRHQTEVEAIRNAYRRDFDEQREKYIDKMRTLELKLEEAEKVAEVMKKCNAEVGQLMNELGCLEDPSESDDVAHVPDSTSKSSSPHCEPEITLRRTPGRDAGSMTDAYVDGELKMLQNRLAVSQTEARQFAEENERLNDQMKKLEEQLNNQQQHCRNPECDQLKQNIQHLHQLLDQREQLLLQLQDQREQLQRQLQDQREQLDKNRRETEQARRDAESNVDELRSTKERLERATAESNRLDEQLAKLSRELTASQEAAAAAQRQLEAENDKGRQLRKDFDELTERLRASGDKQDEQQRRVEAMNRSLREEADKRISAEQELRRKSQALTIAEDAASKLERRVEELQRNVHALAGAQQDTADLQRHLVEQTAANRRLDEQLKAANQRREEAINMAQQMRQHVESEKKSFGSFRQEFDQLRQKLYETETRLARQIGRERELQNQLEEIQRNPQQPSRERELRNQLEEMQRNLHRLQETEGVYETTIRDYMIDFQRERAEKEQLQKKCNDLQANLKQQIEAVADLHDQLFALQPPPPPQQRQQPQQPQQQQQQQQQDPQQGDVSLNSSMFFKKHQQN